MLEVVRKKGDNIKYQVQCLAHSRYHGNSQLLFLDCKLQLRVSHLVGKV